MCCPAHSLVLKAMFKLCVSPLVKQTHYAETDMKWPNEVNVNHIDNEMFTVQYAVVVRTAMVSGAPQLAGAKVTRCNTVSKWLMCR